MPQQHQFVSGEIILASSSAFRQSLLRSAGISFEVIVPEGDEASVKTLEPAQTALERAIFKARDVSRRHPQRIVLGADQTLNLDGEMFSKARSRHDAQQQLSRLQGKTHQLHSAYALVYAPEGRAAEVTLTAEIVSVAMKMRPLSSSDIEAYLDTGEWQGSVGSYKIEGRGILLFDAPIGDRSTIIGLPLAEILANLRAIGIDLLRSPIGPWKI